MTATELKQKLSGSDTPLVLDVRDAEELRGPLGHIHGAMHIPLGELPAHVGDLLPHQQDVIVLVCHGGGRAARGAALLQQEGFSLACVLEGGMLAWSRL